MPFREDPVRVASLRELCQSGFEREMFDVLVGKGYRVRPQVKVGAYSIDFVVEGEQDRRLAIENQPGAAEVGILKKGNEGGPSLLAIIAEAVESVVRLHEVEEQFAVGCFGDTKLRAVSHGDSRPRFPARAPYPCRR